MTFREEMLEKAHTSGNYQWSVSLRKGVLRQKGEKKHLYGVWKIFPNSDDLFIIDFVVL